MTNINQLFHPTVFDGFVINADDILCQKYMISPFQTQDMRRTRDNLSAEMEHTFPLPAIDGMALLLTQQGRSAIRICMQMLKLKTNDVISIFTSSDNRYISGCVTHEIEKVCRWSRQIEPHTKAIFVNHEFGKIHPDMAMFRAYGVPIISDCAHAFWPYEPDHRKFDGANFVIFSLPKFFPLQCGGMLLYDRRYTVPENDVLPKQMEHYLHSGLISGISMAGEWAIKRMENHATLEMLLTDLGVCSRFIFESDETPGVFLFRTPSSWDLPLLKKFLNANGLECSVFYGEQSFYIPVHHALTQTDLDYFSALMHYYVKWV